MLEHTSNLETAIRKPDYVRAQLQRAASALDEVGPRAARDALCVLSASDFDQNAQRAEGLLAILRDRRATDRELRLIAECLLRLGQGSAVAQGSAAAKTRTSSSEPAK